jgi:DNA-binding CsgD family transcriptional regulator
MGQAMRVAETTGNAYLKKRATVKMASILQMLGHYDESSALLNAIGGVNDQDPILLRVDYYSKLGAIAAEFGNASEAYGKYDHAVRIAEEDDDLNNKVAAWENYSHAAYGLGDIELVKSCRERALFIARQTQNMWRIPHYCVLYAQALAIMGQHDVAYDYLLEALSYDVHIPSMEPYLAEVGIPLALYMKDKAMLAKCARPRALTIAFQSNAPTVIAPTVAVFAKLYILQGNEKEAQTLLREALQSTLPVNCIWSLPLEVARNGYLEDISSARKMLEMHSSRHPGSEIDRACLSLFDAFVAQRENRFSDMHMCARDAIAKFERLQWYVYADTARSLIPAALRAPRTAPPRSAPFLNTQSELTAREQQVAELVLRGLTNRAIATELSITENTVEKHMASIMGRLGIRSRYQLVETLRIP